MGTLSINSVIAGTSDISGVSRIYDLTTWTTGTEQTNGDWNAGIARSVADGGSNITIWMPPGTYTQDGAAFDFAYSDITVLGAGSSTILKAVNWADKIVLTNNGRSGGWAVTLPWPISDATKGNSYVDLGEAPSNISAGDAVFIEAGSNSLDPEYGEYNVVTSVSSTRINLSYPLSRTYNLGVAPYNQKTSANFTMPAVDSSTTVDILLLDDTPYEYNESPRPFLQFGQSILEVTAVGAGPNYTATIKNTGLAGNVAPSTVVSAGTKVVKCVCVYKCADIPQGQTFSSFHIEDDSHVRALDASHAINARFNSVTMSGAYSDGIEVGNQYPQTTDSGRDTIFSNCAFTNTSGVLVGHPISRSGCEIIYNNCTFTDVAVGGGEFVSDAEFNNNTMNYNITTNRGIGYVFSFGSSTKSIQFIGNTINVSGVNYVFDKGDITKDTSDSGYDNQAEHPVSGNTITGGDTAVCSPGLITNGRVAIC